MIEVRPMHMPQCNKYTVQKFRVKLFRLFMQQGDFVMNNNELACKTKAMGIRRYKGGCK